jgi:hypothetical protein
MLGELQDTDLELLFAACAGACSKAACGHKCCSTSEHCKCAATCDISGHADSLLIVGALLSGQKYPSRTFSHLLQRKSILKASYFHCKKAMACK